MLISVISWFFGKIWRSNITDPSWQVNWLHLTSCDAIVNNEWRHSKWCHHEEEAQGYLINVNLFIYLFIYFLFKETHINYLHCSYSTYNTTLSTYSTYNTTLNTYSTYNTTLNTYSTYNTTLNTYSTYNTIQYSTKQYITILTLFILD